MNYSIINFQEHGDARGKLLAIESNRDIPFEIKRRLFSFWAIFNDCNIALLHIKIKCETNVFALFGVYFNCISSERKKQALYCAFGKLSKHENHSH
jgi:hypothetical protein